MPSDSATPLFVSQPLMAWAALGCAAISAAILLWYLFFRPQVDARTRVLLLLGVGVFPIGTAITGNYVAFEHTTSRQFCGSCHVMEPYTADSSDLTSDTLAAAHGRNELFGNENCYACHSDYGMYGLVATKLNGMGHVWYYYSDYHDDEMPDALARIHIRQPFPNANCTHCHSTATPIFSATQEHVGMADELATGEASCASSGCHGPAHPFSKPYHEREGEESEEHAEAGR
jgi:cytochrome c-type protein NapC